MAHHEVTELPFVKPGHERTIEGTDVYIAGENDQVTTGRTLTIKKTAKDHWVGCIDTDLSPYTAIRLELRLPQHVTPATTEVVVGPRIRGETLITGLGPQPS